jgi:hypothetical protein
VQVTNPGTLESRMHGNVQVRFGRGLSEKGGNAPRWESTSPFKRAAVKFGVARYLYRDGVPSFGRAEAPAHPRPAPDPMPAEEAAPAANARGQGAAAGNIPRTGKALFAWTKDQEQRYEVSLLKYLNNWAKLQEFPSRMVEWDTEQVNLAYAEACRKLQAIDAAHQEAHEEALSN